MAIKYVEGRQHITDWINDYQVFNPKDKGGEVLISNDDVYAGWFRDGDDIITFKADISPISPTRDILAFSVGSSLNLSLVQDYFTEQNKNDSI